jgi:RNA polymerase sigma-70 factor (ECF subfamily)
MMLFARPPLPFVGTPPEAAAPDPLLILVRRFQSGDTRAAEPLLRELGAIVLHVARTFARGDDALVEDVAQEALLAVARGLHAFRGDCGIRHYAWAIAARVALLARRRARKERESIREVASWLDAKGRSPQSLPAEELLRSERRKAICTLLDGLPVAQAEALVQRYFFGHSLEEVARMVDAPENTVRSRLRLAREAVQERLAREPSLAAIFEDR